MDILSPSEQLFAVCKKRATGSLTLKAGKAQSRIFCRDGEVVGAELGWGYRSVGQALVQSGRLPLRELDALWAAGELEQPHPELLQRLGIDDDAETLRQLQWMTRLRAVVLTAESARFDEGAEDEGIGEEPVRSDFPPIQGERLLQSLGFSQGAP